MTTTIGGATGITFPDATTQNTSPYTGGLAFRNRIINGAMMIDQRNAGASVTVTSSTGYTLDRWSTGRSVDSKYSVQQNAGSVTPPVGFKNYLGVTSLSAYSVTSSDYFFIYQPIEGLNIADLNWGTANASTVTLSFKVYSSLTGTFGGSIRNSAANRSYPFTYTVTSVNTWTSISVTIPGDTSGTWFKTNGVGMYVQFGLGVGSTNSGTAGAWASASYLSATGATSVVGTNGATFYITGVQLEKGSTATSFDYRPYGTELALCQRYYQITSSGAGVYYGGGGVANMLFTYIQSMRANPSVSANGVITITDGYSANYTQSSVGTITINQTGPTSIFVGVPNFSGLTNARYYFTQNNTSTYGLTLSAEL